MEKTPGQNIPKPMPAAPAAPEHKLPQFFDAKRMSFDGAGSQGSGYDFSNSPPLASFLGRGVGFKMEGDPLTSMASATRRDSLKGMHNFSDFSSD